MGSFTPEAFAAVSGTSTEAAWCNCLIRCWHLLRPSLKASLVLIHSTARQDLCTTSARFSDPLQALLAVRRRMRNAPAKLPQLPERLMRGTPYVALLNRPALLAVCLEAPCPAAPQHQHICIGRQLLHSLNDALLLAEEFGTSTTMVRVEPLVSGSWMLPSKLGATQPTW